MDRSLRLFVAAYPPRALAEGWLDRVRGLSPARPTPAGRVHLTLLFIGQTPRSALEQTRESIERSVSGLRAIELSAVRLRTLPERGEARLIALETTAPPALLEVQRRLARRLAANRGRGSRSPFLPHMTLARFGGSGGGRVEASVPPDAFFITELLLMQSVLLPDGACHSQIAAFPLQPAP